MNCAVLLLKIKTMLPLPDPQVTENKSHPSAQGSRVSVKWKIVLKTITLTRSHYKKPKYNRVCFYSLPLSK